MFFFLSKLLPLFFYPISLVCILLIVALFLWRWPRRQQVVLVVALILLCLGSSPLVAATLARSLEWRYLPSDELPPADVIVVMGGGVRSSQSPRTIVEVNEAGDRMVYAAWLYKQGKAEHLLLSGGVTFAVEESVASEAENMASILSIMGIPPEALWLETRSRNTYENAVNTRLFLEKEGINRILLVTSALHMPRAVLTFKRQGFEVIPAPADFLVTKLEWDALQGGRPSLLLLSLIPDVDALQLTTHTLREYLGIAVYKLRGWL